jgi:hypothetical protein
LLEIGLIFGIRHFPDSMMIPKLADEHVDHLAIQSGAQQNRDTEQTQRGQI